MRRVPAVAFGLAFSAGVAAGAAVMFFLSRRDVSGLSRDGVDLLVLVRAALSQVTPHAAELTIGIVEDRVLVSGAVACGETEKIERQLRDVLGVHAMQLSLVEFERGTNHGAQPAPEFTLRQRSESERFESRPGAALKPDA